MTNAAANAPKCLVFSFIFISSLGKIDEQAQLFYFIGKSVASVWKVVKQNYGINVVFCGFQTTNLCILPET